MIRGLIFSPVFKEIMAIAKEDLPSSLSTNIFDRCGKKINISEGDLYNYLVEFEFANRGREKTA